MHSSRGIPAADEQPEVTIDLEYVLRDLGFGSIACASNLCEVELEETLQPAYWQPYEVQPREDVLAERTVEEQSTDVPLGMPDDGPRFLSQVSVFLANRWRVAAQASVDFLTAEIDFLIGDAIDDS